MGRNFKMFDHIVDPETRSKGLKFMGARPLETFLFISFAYMLIRFFSYISLVHAYMALIIYCYFLKYGNYYMDRIYDRAFNEFTNFMKREQERIILAPFMKPPDILDGNDLVEKEDSGEDVGEDVAEDVGEDLGEDSAEDVVEGAEEEEETDAVDMQKDMDEMVQKTEHDSYLELRKRHVPRG